MTRTELLDDVQARLTALWGPIQTRQNAYFAAHGRYFQGGISHALIPTDGVDAPPDRTAVRLHDQAETWADFGGLPASLRFAVQLDTYQTPVAHGYVVTVYVRWQGEVWTRSRQSGPDPGRTRGWERVLPRVLPAAPG